MGLQICLGHDSAPRPQRSRFAKPNVYTMPSYLAIISNGLSFCHMSRHATTISGQKTKFLDHHQTFAYHHQSPLFHFYIIHLLLVICAFKTDLLRLHCSSLTHFSQISPLLLQELRKRKSQQTFRVYFFYHGTGLLVCLFILWTSQYTFERNQAGYIIYQCSIQGSTDC